MFALIAINFSPPCTRDGQVKSIFDLNQVNSSHKLLDLTGLGNVLKRKRLDFSDMIKSQVKFKTVYTYRCFMHFGFDF